MKRSVRSILGRLDLRTWGRMVRRVGAGVSGVQLVQSPIDRDELLHAICIVNMDTFDRISW
jgi:hypothetical protein